MNEFKSTYEKVSEIKKEIEVFNCVSIGFTQDYCLRTKRNTAYHEIGETILEFVRDCSSTFCSDIATKALKYGNPSDKQSWCVAYEFIKIQHMYDAWVEDIVAKLKESENI